MLLKEKFSVIQSCLSNEAPLTVRDHSHNELQVLVRKLKESLSQKPLLGFLRERQSKIK